MALLNVGFKHELARELLAQGADPNVTDSDGCTALHWAADIGATEVARVLLEHGADVTLKNYNGKTAVDWCTLNASQNHNECMDVLQSAWLSSTQK